MNRISLASGVVPEFGPVDTIREAKFCLKIDVKTISQAIEIIKPVGHPPAAPAIDPLHVARSGGTPADVAEVPRNLLPYAQFRDATASGPVPEDGAESIRDAIDLRPQTARATRRFLAATAHTQ